MSVAVAISRRSFLMGSAAAIVAAQIVGVAAVEGFAAPVEAAAPAVKAGSWGYSLCGDEWYAGFYSREDAVNEALGYERDGAFETGFCTPEPFGFPDADDVVQWLDDPGYPLGIRLADAFSDCNEDRDWEGGLSDAIANSDTAQLDADARAIVSAALIRHGQIDAAAAVMMWSKEARDEPIIEDQGVLDAISRDQMLSDDIARIVRAWVDANDIEDAPRTLMLAEQQSHEFPAAEAA